VAQSDEDDDAATAVEERLGLIDTWINDAMVTVVSPVTQLGADEIKRVTEVTYLGAVNGTITALRRMMTRDRGSIVKVNSALAYRAIPMQAATRRQVRRPRLYRRIAELAAP
jgi:NADP-dependent 3-hydroxy acid dehydrogenase YdfG